jgi:4a-hydroxytetrahydrobiopterin dehydratase
MAAPCLPELGANQVTQFTSWPHEWFNPFPKSAESNVLGYGVPWQRASFFVQKGLLLMALLTDEQVAAALSDLDGWERRDGALRRSIKFGSFLAGIDAVRRVGEHAESKDHHPDIDIRWRTVTFALVTHSEGGITKNDVEMAREINEIVAG